MIAAIIIIPTTTVGSFAAGSDPAMRYLIVTLSIP
jgi:hypothetical protein